MSDERIDITEAELIAAILDGGNGRTVDLRDGATTAEIAAAKGWSEKRARKQIKLHLDAGHLEHVEVWRERMDGRLNLVPAYKVKQSEL